MEKRHGVTKKGGTFSSLQIWLTNQAKHSPSLYAPYLSLAQFILGAVPWQLM